jgi:hypothetical protein
MTAKTLFVSGLLVLLTALPPAQAALNAQSAGTDLQVPLTGTVFYDLSDESLPLTGWLHINTQLTPRGAVSVHANLDGVSGIGETTGIRYNAIGGAQTTLAFDDSTTADFDFRIIPADGFTLSCILRLRLTLTFDADGTLTGVSIDDMSVVH